MATQNHAGLEELFPLESGGILALSTPLWVCLKEGCIKLGRLGKLVQILRRRCAFMCWYHFEPPNISENRIACMTSWVQKQASERLCILAAKSG